jgi:hypothetical protein
LVQVPGRKRPVTRYNIIIIIIIIIDGKAIPLQAWTDP